MPRPSGVDHTENCLGRRIESSNALGRILECFGRFLAQGPSVHRDSLSDGRLTTPSGPSIGASLITDVEHTRSHHG